MSAQSTSQTIVTNSLNKNTGLRLLNPPKITVEQEKRLRDELHIEIANKTKACSNIAYECSLSRIDGYDYCIRHILQDPLAPYKQCTFLLSNGKRCLQPAPKYDPKKDILTSCCFEHSRQSQLTKTRNSIGKYKHVETTETILNDLSHHINLSKVRALANRSFDSADGETRLDEPYIDPFSQINAAAKNASGRKILDYASDSSSDVDTPTVSNTWRGQDYDNSDNESIDSQNEDLLKHAEVYSTEQATKVLTEKLSRLRNLYIDQLYRLKHVLREKRRNYLHSLRAERDTLCSIHDQPKETIRERKLYEKLKSLNKYHKRNGVEALLHKKFVEKRQRSRDGVQQPITPKPSFHIRCIFTEGGVKCGERIIPCTKYCRKHILEDKKQVLFRTCGTEKGGVVCCEPVANIFEDATCTLHIQLPPQRNYVQKKYESDSEDEIDVKPKSEIKIEDVEKADTSSVEHQSATTINQTDEQMTVSTEENFTICHEQSTEQATNETSTNNETTDSQPNEAKISDEVKPMDIETEN